MNNPLLSFLGIAKKSGNIVLGMDSVKKQISKEKVKLILVTKDISKHSLKEIQRVSTDNKIKILQISNSKDDIESAIRKYTAIIGILDENLAFKINDIISKANITIENTTSEQTSTYNQEECNL